MTFGRDLLLFLLLTAFFLKAFSAPINDNLESEDLLDAEESDNEDTNEESGDDDLEGSGVKSELAEDKDEDNRQSHSHKNENSSQKTKNVKNAETRTCRGRGCGGGEDEDEWKHHEEDDDLHHHHHHGHHEHEHEHHHHGHHHGFIHEWGQEEGGEHHGHEGHGHHEHCHEHEHEHQHEQHEGHEGHEGHGHHHEDDCEECGGYEGGGGGRGGGGWFIKKELPDNIANRRQNVYERLPLAYHCRDIVSKSGKDLPTKRFCVPLNRRAAIAWGDISSEKKFSKSNRNKKRDTLEKATKKQTVHIGYGYASGDNYRLGYQLGGMGGLASSFSGVVLPNRNFGARESIKKSRINSRTNIVGNGFGKRTDLGGFEPTVNNAGGSSTPYGHPVTHPGFTTMGYPGLAMASADVRNKILQPQNQKVSESIFEQQPVFIQDFQLDNRNQHFETQTRYVSVLAE